MAKTNRIEQLDTAVQAMMANRGARVQGDTLVTLAAELRDMPRASFRARLKSELMKEAEMASTIEQETTPAVDPVPKGYRTLTPYIVVQDAEALLGFVRDVFGGELMFRTVGSAGGIHSEVRVDDSMLMIGGGGKTLAWRGESKPGAFHVYVRDCDAAYQRALAAGAESVDVPKDQEYGERGASVKDRDGNYWYLATRFGKEYKDAGTPTVIPYLHPQRADSVMSFLKNAFAAEELARYASPDGVVHHMSVRIGSSLLEMGEAHDKYQPMKSMFYLYVSDCDAVYRQALEAGASSIYPPTDHDYGDRGCGVRDVFGYEWYIATHTKDVQGR
jgi:uncharacterized glyoxalase superfamily protein PhnB